MAEALAGPLRRALAEELAAHAGWGSKGSSAVGGVHAAKSSSSAGSSAGSSPHAISQPELRQRRRDARLAGLPPPMVPGNYESPSMMCAMQVCCPLHLPCCCLCCHAAAAGHMCQRHGALHAHAGLSC